jgi:hypothetical protein
MMLPSRKLAATFFCVFLLGALTGGLLFWSLADLRFNDFLNRTSDPKKLADRLDQKLTAQYHLDADEQKRIAPLTQEMAQNLYALRHQFATDVLDSIDKSHEKIAGKMNPDHSAAYQKDNDDRHKRAAAVLMPGALTDGSPH